MCDGCQGSQQEDPYKLLIPNTQGQDPKQKSIYHMSTILKVKIQLPSLKYTLNFDKCASITGSLSLNLNFLPFWTSASECVCVKKHGSQTLAHFLSPFFSLSWLHPTLEQTLRTSSIQSLSRVRPFATPWIAAHLSITNSRSLLRLLTLESVMPSNHLILCPSPPTFNLSQHQGLFKWVSCSHQVAKVLEFQLQHQTFQWTPRTDLL